MSKAIPEYTVHGTLPGLLGTCSRLEACSVRLLALAAYQAALMPI